MFQTLLQPVDGSPQAERSLQWSLEIARRAKATLHLALVHVPDAFYEYFPDHEAEDRGTHDQEAAYLATLGERIAKTAPVDCRTHLLEGIVPETLTAEAERREADLVVMSAHGWGYMSRALLGSVSDHLIRHLNIPLLLVNADEQHPSDLGDCPTVHRLLVPLDGSATAEAVLPRAADLARLWNAEIRLLQVVAVGRRWFDTGDAGNEAELAKQGIEQAIAYLSLIKASLERDGLKVETRATSGNNVAQTILEHARDCQLIAVATTGRSGLGRLVLGSVTDKVVRAAKTPVLVLRPGDSGA